MCHPINRRQAIHTLGTLGAAASLPALSHAADTRPPNVLFIAVDDLRPQLKCYGHHQMISPAMDTLAREGIRFTHAYCQVPVCGASRASLLSGLRPDRNRFVGYSTRKDEDAPEATSLPRHFRQQGYITRSRGKIYHHRNDDLDAWSDASWSPERSPCGSGRNYHSPENVRLESAENDSRGPAFEAGDVDDFTYFDGQMTRQCIRDLRELSQQDQPFFLAAGFMKPHLPFNAPRRFWDMYSPDDLDMADNPFAPKDAPRSALHNWGELRKYHGIPPKGPLDDDMARTLVHGYYACTTYTDYLIGHLLDELDRQGLRDNTIVILWGDHGWNLQEHGLWCKHSNFETSLHVPLLVRAPGHSQGIAVSGLTEFVDIYPSLCELAGLPVPDHCQGSSFVPLMNNPRREWKPAAFSRYIKGDSVKTARYRYTEWTNNEGYAYEAMLYDHRYDPMENINVVNDPEYAEARTRMKQWIADGWEKARPET